MTGERENICSGCFGRVRIPTGSRSFTIEQIMEHHKISCPAWGVKRSKEEQHEESPVS